MRDLTALCASTACLLWPAAAHACGRCAPLVRIEVFDADFLGQVCLLLAPLGVIGALAWAATKLEF